MSGMATSATGYTVDALGQNQTTVVAGTLPNYGHGTFQHGTTTFKVHPTLPMVRWTDPVYGSGVAYYHAPTSRIVVGHTDFGNNQYFGMSVGYPTAAPNTGTWTDLGLFGFFTGVGIVGILAGLAAVPALGVAAVALGFAAAILGLAGLIFGLIRVFESTPQLPPPPNVSLVDNSATYLAGAPGDGYGPPDGGGTDGLISGGYPNGGGGAGSDQLVLC